MSNCSQLRIIADDMNPRSNCREHRALSAMLVVALGKVGCLSPFCPLRKRQVLEKD